MSLRNITPCQHFLNVLKQNLVFCHPNTGKALIVTGRGTRSLKRQREPRNWANSPSHWFCVLNNQARYRTITSLLFCELRAGLKDFTTD